MPQEEHHVALPRLYGQPAYARPPRSVDDQPRPFDPDELPLEVEMSDEERMVAESLLGRPYPIGAREPQVNGHDGSLSPRPLRLKKIASRILRGA